MQLLTILKGVPLLSVIPIVFLSSSSEFISDKKGLDKLEIVLKVGSDSSETLRIPIGDIIASKGKNAEKKGSDNSGSSISSDKEKYEKRLQLSKQFLEVQHSMNLIKSSRGKTEKSQFSSLCDKCTGSSGGGQSSCNICICCKKGQQCTNQPICCCTDTKTCEGKMDSNTQESFFGGINNLLGSKGVYLSPIKMVLNIDTTDTTNISAGNLTGSLFYGFVDYKYKEIDQISSFSSDVSAIKGEGGDNSQTSSESNKYFANIPQRFSITNGEIKTIYEKLNDKEKVKKLMEENSTTSSTCDLCLCCQTTDDINCLLNRNYSISMDNENANKLQKAIEGIKDCCKTT